MKNKSWYWDEVNPNAAACYIQFGNDHFDHIQPVRPYDDILPIKDHEIFVGRTRVSHPDQVLECIVKHIIPLYIHIMAKINHVLNCYLRQIIYIKTSLT